MKQPTADGLQKICRASIAELLRVAEFEYSAAILEYEKAVEEGVSSFHEQNTASYKKGIRDAYRNLLLNATDLER